MKNINTCLFLALVLAVALMRILPHPYNITPVGALGLFSGAYMHHRYAWLVPVAALLIGDMVTGFYGWHGMFFVYLGFAVSAIIGRLFLAEQRSVNRLGLGILTAAIAFYLLSNFGSWLMYYPKTLAGLVQCYVNGLPYLLRSLIGDTLYCILLFGTFESVRRLFELRGEQARAS